MENQTKYKDGDIVIATIAPPASGLLFHRGIIYYIKDKNKFSVPHVFHNTPMKLNRYGGNVILESLESFEADGRTIVDIQPSGVNINEVIRRNEIVKKKKFDWADFNCEHYVTYVTKGEMKSLQLHRYMFITVIGLVTFFTIRFAQKMNKK